MSIKDDIIKLINAVYRVDDFITSYTDAVAKVFNKINLWLDSVKNNIFFDSLDEDGAKWWESLLKIDSNPTQTLSDRRSKIRAKWISKNHSNLKLLQSICESWRAGEVEVTFENGKIEIQFLRKYGVPSDIDNLKSSIEEAKPAHLIYGCKYKYPAFRLNVPRVNKTCIFANSENIEEYEAISVEEEENEF